jgi:UDPglucose--hexose-1-phosphate uridylyltransferase
LLNEIRKGYLLTRGVVIATSRQLRPVDFARKTPATHLISNTECPFCPGNERKTPPAVLVYLKRGRNIIKESDTDGHRHKDWIIRCVPNLYPAFSPPPAEESIRLDRAVGHHEVLIESPAHAEHPAAAPISQLVHVVNGYIDRFETLSAKRYVSYVSIFRNHGISAGASLSHAHSQIIGANVTPEIPRVELESSKAYHDDHGTCVFCDTLKAEMKGPRHIWENRSFTAFAPWASIHPFEFRVLPKMHQDCLLDLRRKTIVDFAEILKTCLGGLNSLLNDPPYNYGFHTLPRNESSRYYHWHLEVYPKLSIWAGFEKSTGMYINVVSPEQAASDLRQAIAEAA